MHGPLNATVLVGGAASALAFLLHRAQGSPAGATDVSADLLAGRLIVTQHA